MKIEYRLIQIMESWDRTIHQSVDIFEFTTIEYNLNKTGYHFKRHPDANNHFFVFLSSEGKIEEFESIKEDIIEMNMIDFVFEILHPPEGPRKTFFSKELYALRKKS